MAGVGWRRRGRCWLGRVGGWVELAGYGLAGEVPGLLGYLFFCGIGAWVNPKVLLFLLFF